MIDYDWENAPYYDWDEVWILSYAQPEAPDGKNYFMRMSSIGPVGTWHLEDAVSFPSEEAAMQSPAFTFALTFYRPEKLVP